MNHLAAAILLSLGGKEVNESNLREVIVAGGSKVNEAVVSKVVKHCQGKDVLQLCKEGLKKLGALSASKPAENKESKDDKKGGKKEESKPKVEEKPVEDEEDAGGFGDLFG